MPFATLFVLNQSLRASQPAPWTESSAMQVPRPRRTSLSRSAEPRPGRLHKSRLSGLRKRRRKWKASFRSISSKKISTLLQGLGRCTKSAGGSSRLRRRTSQLRPSETVKTSLKENSFYRVFARGQGSPPWRRSAVLNYFCHWRCGKRLNPRQPEVARAWCRGILRIKLDPLQTPPPTDLLSRFVHIRDNLYSVRTEHTLKGAVRMISYLHRSKALVLNIMGSFLDAVRFGDPMLKAIIGTYPFKGKGIGGMECRGCRDRLTIAHGPPTKCGFGPYRWGSLVLDRSTVGRVISLDRPQAPIIGTFVYGEYRF